jgi:hypothetical protein
MTSSSEDALLLLQRILFLEDALAQHRHAEQSLRTRLTELENRVSKVFAQSLVVSEGES